MNSYNENVSQDNDLPGSIIALNKYHNKIIELTIYAEKRRRMRNLRTIVPSSLYKNINLLNLFSKWSLFKHLPHGKDQLQDLN